jgi:hypothetical protein
MPSRRQHAPTRGAPIATNRRRQEAVQSPEYRPSAAIDTATAYSAKRAHLRRLLAQIDVAEAMRRRAMEQALLEVLPEYWLHRSRSYASVGTPECDLIAENCRNHARLLAGEFGPIGEPWPGFDEDLDLVLAEREVA